MKENPYSYDEVNDTVKMLLSYDDATIKTHFLVSQIYVKSGMGKKALNYLLSVKSSVSSNELEASDSEIKKLNTAIDLCRSATKNTSKTDIIANKMYEDYCL